MLHQSDIVCPWCWVTNTVLVDCSAGDSQLVEDCTVCCRPMVLNVRVGADSELLGVEVAREND